MLNKKHYYKAAVKWTGNKGEGTSSYKAYEREHIISVENKPDIMGSSDVSFRGNKNQHNPEELLVCSISSCHMLWYLHLCSEAGVIVVEYIDKPIGIMTETSNGSGYFTEVTLYPTVTVQDMKMMNKAKELHESANKLCFIANSVNFPIYHNPTVVLGKNI